MPASPKSRASTPYTLRNWVVWLVVLLPSFAWAQLVQVDQVSQPAGFVSDTQVVEVGAEVITVLPQLSSNGYIFGYWKLGEERLADGQGRSVVQPTVGVSAAITLTAHYFLETEDTDGDGVRDWFEWRNFGTLYQGQQDDADGDGFTNGQEDALGQAPTIFDEVEDGGVPARRSPPFTYADTSMVKYTMKSDPLGFVDTTERYVEINGSTTSANLHGESNGYTFAYWSVNGVRQAAGAGVAVSQVTTRVEDTTLAIAHYLPTTEDSDGDGVADWFELNQFGDLNSGPQDDADGDNFSNAQEEALGQEATIRDEVEDGGVTARRSPPITYADTSMVAYTLKSEPAGFVEESTGYVEQNATVTTPNLHGESNGYTFAYWSLNGVRQTSPNGLSISQVTASISATITLIAHYLPTTEDSDGDGVADWFEMYQFGDLSQSPDDDMDGDGFSNRQENELGQEALIIDEVEDGGVTARRSKSVLYFEQQNHAPSGLELNNTITFTNLPADSLVGGLTPTDLNDAQLEDTYTYSLLAGPGGEDYARYSLSTHLLRTANLFSEEANHSLLIRVTDPEGLHFDQNFTIHVLDPAGDPDGDGLSNQQEWIAGTRYDHPDSDGDGFSDGTEISAGTNPLDANSFPNSAPTDLNSTDVLQVAENQPVGTFVGEFNATDPDNGAILTYTLVSGQGDTHNDFFSLDENGTLTTVSVLDYEAGQSLSIRVRVQDEYNAQTEGNFTVLVTNDPADDVAGTFTVSGGQHEFPYFQFTDADGHTPDFSTLRLQKGAIYEFVSSNIASGHTFMIGESYGDTSSELVTGNTLNSYQNGQKLTLAIPADFSGELYYFCTYHSHMVQPFLLADNYVDLNKGLVAWYPFDGNASDMSGNGNHATVYGATLTTDRHGEANKAYSFDGGDWIEAPHFEQLNFSGDQSFTVSVWTKIDPVDASGTILEKWTSSNDPYPFAIRYGLGSGNLSYAAHRSVGGSSTAISVNATSAYRENAHHHLTIVSTETDIRIYQDSILMDSYSFSPNEFTNSHKLIFGKREGRTDRSLYGVIDDVRIYNYAFGGKEIRYLYKKESPHHFTDLNSSTDLEMIWVEPGTFTMGQYGVAEPEHNVTLTQGFYLGKYEVTQAQYEAVMTGNTEGLSATPSGYANHPNRPVEKVSWHDLQVFLRYLNEQEADSLPAGWAYVLPTEAQWEYACRAGTTTTYSWGDEITSENANYGQQVGQPSTVGNYAANPWGFFDMHGNVWEWTADAMHSYSTDAQTDPHHAGLTNSNRMVRGGPWNDTAEKLASSFRNSDYPDNGADNRGFRLALKNTNQAPVDLNSTTPLTIAENQPIGTIVGEFSAIDPDTNLTSSFSNSFVLNSTGGGGKLLFHDLNKDGRQDWIDGSGRIYLGGADGFEEEIRLPSSGIPAVGDFDGDGFLDVFIGVWNSANKIFYGDSENSFSRSISISEHPAGQNSNRVSGAAAIDINQDGWLDVVISHVHGINGRALINEGSDSFSNLTATYFTNLQRNLESADFNNDGLLDLVDSYFAGVNFQKSEGGLRTTQDISRAGNGMIWQPSGGPLGVGDLNGDGLQDVVILMALDGGETDKTGAFVLYNTDGTGEFDFITSLGRGEHLFKAADIGDIDNDGDGDVALLKNNGTELLLYENLGDGNFSLFEHDFEFTNGSDVEFVDFDNDGDLDLAISGSQKVWENESPITVTYQLVSREGDGNNSLFTLDTNGALKTATVFDYETNASTYTIRVQARDELNATVEGNFTVTLEDVFEDLDGDGIEDHLDDDMDGDGFTNDDENGIGSDPTDSSSTPLNIGLVSWWKFDESEGFSVSDSSGNGNHASLKNGATWHKGKVDGGVILDGFDDWVDAGQKAEYVLNEGFTLSVWVNPTQYSNWAGVIGRGIGANGGRYILGALHLMIQPELGYPSLEICSGSALSSVHGSSSVPLNRWSHLAATWDGNAGENAIKVYFNGELESQASSSFETLKNNFSGNDGKMRLGVRDIRRGNGSSRGYFNGKLDEARVYNRELSGIEINAVYDLAPNNPPIALNTTDVLAVSEKQPVGTIVGEFNATDSDGDTITYHLVSGEGDGNNSLFTLDQNGTLKTAVVLDYEAGETLTIRVQARDEYNATVEGNFTVSVIPRNNWFHTITGLSGMHRMDLAVSDRNSFGVVGGKNPGGFAKVASYPDFELSFDFEVSTSTQTWVQGVSFDKEENVYIGGHLGASDNFGGINVPFRYERDPWVAKINNQGDWQWVKSVGTNAWSGVDAIVTDEDGNSYVTGYIYSSATFGSQTVGGAGWYDAFLAKIDTNGNWVWAKSVGGSSGDFGRAVVLDGKGGVYWAGDFVGTINVDGNYLASNGGGDLNGGGEIFVAKLDTAGNYVWAVSGGSSDSDQPYDIVADDVGNAYIAARVRGNPSFGEQSLVYQGGNDGVVAKINSTGEWEWARSIGGSGGDLASGVTLSYNNLLQVAGSVQGLGYFNGQNQVGLETKNTTYVVELDTNGDFLRQKSFEGISINDIETSEAGDTLIAGTHSGETNYFGSLYQSPDATDVFVALYDYRPPKLMSIFALGDLNIAENQPIGTVVAEFTATDLDGDEITYHLVSGEGDGNNSLFILDTNGTLRSAEVFDFEQNQEFTIRVQAKNESNLTTEKEFIVSITNDPSDDPVVNQPPTALQTLEPLTVDENQPSGTQVGEFTAEDPDGDDVTFHFVSGENNNSLFTLDTNGTLRSADVFDFEQNQEFTIRVQAKNESNLTTEKEFIVSITNDPSDDPGNRPPFNLRTLADLSILENQPTGTQVGEFTAQDPDGDDVRFSLLNLLSSEDNFFELNASGGGGKLLFADLNEDGREDWVDGSGRIYLAEENGLGAEIKLPASGVPAVGDFDDDGFLDVFFGVFNSADKIFFGDIDASFSRSISISVIPQGQGENRVSGAAAIDFNQDGKLDIFVTHIHGVPGRVMINNGDGNFTHLRDSSISTVQRHLEVADFDNDGLPDLLDSMQAGVNFLKAEGGIQPTAGVHQAGGGMLGHQPSGGPLAVGDLNGDGLEDVMILHSTDGGEADKTGAFVLHNADGAGKFNFLTILGRGEHIFKAGDIGDIDNDGDGDIALLKSNGSRLLIYQNHGDGNFSLLDPEIEFTGASDLTFVDYDQDGFLELAISGPQIMVENLGMQNLANHLFTMGEDGVLRTATIFDFESNSSTYTIRVQATDEHNLSVEQNFTITLLDEDENIPPSELHPIDPLIAEENQPIGTQVGGFTAEDPDGDDLTFQFVSGENNNSLFTLDTNGTLKAARSFDFEVDGPSFTIEVEARDPSGARVAREFVVTLIDDLEGEARLVVKDFVSSGLTGRIGTLEVQEMQGLTFQLGPDEFGNLHHFTLSKDGELTLEEELWDSGTHTLNILIFDGDELVAEPQITIEVNAPEREDFLAADTTDPAYHESALMIRDLDVVQRDWRNGHNPIKSMGSIEGRDGLFVTTAQPHGRKEGDSVVLSGVKGLQIEGLRNWNFLIDEVNATSFRIRHFGKNANGVHDGSFGQLARAVVGTAYQTTQSDFLLGPWTFGHLLGNMVGEQDDPMTFYKHFANQWKNRQIVNGWATDKRPETHRSMVPEGIDELTLSNLPFRLLSIGNRLDLFHAKSIGDIADAGEGRFVFTMTRPFELPFEEENIWKVHQQSPADQRLFTLIFEYGQPARDFATLSKWAKDWHKLEQVSKDFSPSENYLEQLNDLTDRFTKRGANPFKPNGNPINQVRTNDFIGFTLWQMREFNLFSRDAAHNVKASLDRKTLLEVDDELSSIDVGIWTTTTKNNPMVGGNNVHPSLEGALSRWINQRESQILDGEVGPRAPEWMEGPVANEPGGFTYQFESGSVRTNLARYKFSLSTCSGCHTGDTATGFQMVVSNGQRRKARFAPFMEGNRLGGSHQVSDGVDRDEKHEFFDLKAREDIVRDILTIAEQVDAARLRLTRTEVDPLQTSQALAQVFVSGGIIGDWEYSLPAGRKDNEFFSLNSSTGDLSLASSLNQPPLGSLQLFVRATATDGTGVVLERPYSLWILSEGELQLTEDLDPSVQPNDPPPMVTPRPNRTH